MRSAAFAAALAVGAIIGSGAAQAAVVNGSFEDDLQANGTWNIYLNLIGWIGGPNGIELRNNVAGTAFDGVNYIELDTTANSIATQVVGTTNGQNYNLAFAYSPREGVLANSNGIEVFWNGSSLGSVTGVGAPSGNVWALYNFAVIGTGSDTLRFDAIGISESYGGSLDFVSLTERGGADGATPLPAALPLFAAGLGVMGLLARRRKKKIAAVAS